MNRFTKKEEKEDQDKSNNSDENDSMKTGKLMEEDSDEKDDKSKDSKEKNGEDKKKYVLTSQSYSEILEKIQYFQEKLDRMDEEHSNFLIKKQENLRDKLDDLHGNYFAEEYQKNIMDSLDKQTIEIIYEKVGGMYIFKLLKYWFIDCASTYEKHGKRYWKKHYEDIRLTTNMNEILEEDLKDDDFRNWVDDEDLQKMIPQVKSLDKFDAKYLKYLQENWSIFKIKYFNGKEVFKYVDIPDLPDFMSLNLTDHPRIKKLTIVHMKLKEFDADFKWNVLYQEVHEYWYLYYKIDHLKKILKKSEIKEDVPAVTALVLITPFAWGDFSLMLGCMAIFGYAAHLLITKKNPLFTILAVDIIIFSVLTLCFFMFMDMSLLFYLFILLILLGTTDVVLGLTLFTKYNKKLSR